MARTVGIPLVRGLGRFGESLLVLGLVKAKLPNAELPLEGGRVAAALAGSMAATKAVRAVTAKSAVAEEVGTALAAFVPAVLAEELLHRGVPRGGAQGDRRTRGGATGARRQRGLRRSLGDRRRWGRGQGTTDAARTWWDPICLPP